MVLQLFHEQIHKVGKPIGFGKTGGQDWLVGWLVTTGERLSTCLSQDLNRFLFPSQGKTYGSTCFLPLLELLKYASANFNKFAS